jgi:hypothetical protein
MSTLDALENVEIELDRVRKAASRIEDGFILYLIDMTILAVKRKAISECVAFRTTSAQPKKTRIGDRKKRISP